MDMRHLINIDHSHIPFNRQTLLGHVYISAAGKMHVIPTSHLLQTAFINIIGDGGSAMLQISKYRVAVSGSSTGSSLPCCDSDAQERGQARCPKTDPI